MTVNGEWKLSGESNYAPVNAFPARNLNKGIAKGGNWIVAYNNGQNSKNKLLTTPELTPRIEKNLDLPILRKLHGNTPAGYITQAKLSGQHFTSISKKGWHKLKLSSLDATENSLNLSDIEVFGTSLEIIELAFNEMTQISLINPDSFPNLQYLDLSWNSLSGFDLPKLGKLKNLKILNISSNKIADFEINDEDFPKLFHLKMNSNKIRSSCFFQLKKIRRLEELYLTNNQITEIPILGEQDNRIVLSDLRILDLSENPISEESKLMGAASFPILDKLLIIGTDLVKNSKGDPPLLKQFLSDRIGINVQRKEDQKSSRYAKKLSMLSSLKIDDSIPQIKKSTVDERINNYRAEMALEAQKKQAIEAGESTPQNETTEENPENVDAFSDTFFITQEMDEGQEQEIKMTFDSELKKMTETIRQQVAQESTVSLVDENNWLSLTEEEQEEYVNVANSVSNIAAVNELRRLVNTDGATVHRSRAQRLAIQQNPQPYSNQKPGDVVRETLSRLRERQTYTVDSVESALTSANASERKEAEELFGRVKDTFERVREEAMKEAQKWVETHTNVSPRPYL